MGTSIELSNEIEVGGEPVADIRVRYGALKGIDIPEDQVPLAIDEFPVLFVAAACAEGTTVLTGAEELRVKESDRIAAMARGLGALGVRNEMLPDGLRIEGGRIGGGTIDSRGDHRVAMSFAVASLKAEAPIEILDVAKQDKGKKDKDKKNKDKKNPKTHKKQGPKEVMIEKLEQKHFTHQIP